jgi:integrase
MSSRGRHHGVQKVCGCGRSRWPKCAHAWYFRYKPRGGQRWQFSLDVELGKHFKAMTDAVEAAAPIRAAILAGTFRRTNGAPAAEPAATTSITLDQFVPIYIERASKASGKRTWKDDAHRLSRLREHRTLDGRRLGDVPLAAITEDELEAFYASLLAAGLAASTRNHYVQLLKATFRWAARKGYIRNPLSDDSGLKRSKMAQRTRRLSAEEETALLKAAGALDQRVGFRLSGLIVAALETGARRGELLGLQWGDVSLERRELLIRAENAKDAEIRRLPLSSRILAVLEIAQTDPAGQVYPPTAFVFGSFGQRVASVKKAWETCVLRANGHEPTWVSGGKLSPESRVALRSVDLHFHDLRHEAGSRWLESGVPLHHIKELLGHANISQTDTYLNAGRVALHESIKRFDATRGEGPADASTDLRGKAVVNKPEIEHRPVSHAKAEKPSKDLLH